MNSSTRVAIVTGGAQGIGFAFAKALVKADYSVVIGDLSGAEEAAERLRAEGFHSIGVTADVSSSSDVAAMTEQAVRRFGGVDVLVNNAALFTSIKPKSFEQIDEEEWMRVMRVNTLGPFQCAKAVTPHMRKRGGGRIINVASTSVIRGTPMLLHYVSSKGAVVGFTRSLARELGDDNITVNAISPGFTLSDGVIETGLDQKMGQAASTSIMAARAARSLKRDQTPSDLVGTVVFLASDGASFITGQTIAVDGGTVFL
ncbi:glucose 1-dehydrogenase [Paraburkholderia sp. CNPSo 3076]|uniref:SDR family NAD(P)-dependent oxidoreductase n=1 Tax=Paraburkholderia sp. CNPSo 3076 TaxID=2940936 RepID=UPI00225BDA53|nr:glucose 1-dehydrogenase [Paraburkholderia sp. CNPSo 3076]MCX5542110.1 glucose 1-dehydrogenase [Paraburkholderia sp. CNPSo 3076]